MSAKELRTAATRLREAAAKAAPGPWGINGPWWWDGPGGRAVCSSAIVTDPDSETIAIAAPAYNQHPAAEDSAQWIALVSPLLAEPLAAWLESWDGIEMFEGGPMLDDFQHALKIARVINGASAPSASVAPSAPPASTQSPQER